MSSKQRFVLVKRPTRLEELVARFNTRQQARFYIEHSGADFADYEREDEGYQAVILSARRVLQFAGRLQVLERQFLPNFHFHGDDIVVVIGQDGLVANTLKYLEQQPVIAINPDPGRWDGVLLPFVVEQLQEVLQATLRGQVGLRAVSLAQATFSDGQTLRAVNDLFIGPASHQSARYRLTWGKRAEAQSSSGIIVSTGLGSTGWLQSVLAGAAGVSGGEGHPLLGSGLAWDASYLYFSVREPFPSKVTGTEIVFGRVDSSHPMRIESTMPENGVVFSDGIESDYIQFNSGMSVDVGLAETRAMLVVG